jgi:hypothetical protein
MMVMMRGWQCYGNSARKDESMRKKRAGDGLMKGDEEE